MPVRKSDGFRLSRSDFEISGRALEGLFDAASAGGLYINVHSTNVPSGEIRGQLSVAADQRPVDGPLSLTATLSGAQEVPAVSTAASGMGEVRIFQRFDGKVMVSVDLNVDGLGIGPATAMHIHTAPAGTNGGVLLSLDPVGALQSETPADLRAGGIFVTADWTGTAKGDRINGNGAEDRIAGRNGNDTLKGAGGNDDLLGGKGKDLILGGARNDRLSGDGGNDTLRGGLGNDTIKGGAANDVISGDKGADVILGGRGNDLIRTGAGRDTVVYDLDDIFTESTDRLPDFSTGDRFVFAGDGPAKMRFAKVDPDAPGATLGAGKNVVMLTGDGMNIGEAAEWLADQGGNNREGLFAYFDSVAAETRLVYTENFSSLAANIAVVARFNGSELMPVDLAPKNFAFDEDFIV